MVGDLEFKSSLVPSFVERDVVGVKESHLLVGIRSSEMFERKVKGEVQRLLGRGS